MSTVVSNRAVDPVLLCTELAASVKVASTGDGLTEVTADVPVERLQAVVDQHQPAPAPTTVTVEVDPARLAALRAQLGNATGTTASVVRGLLDAIAP